MPSNAKMSRADALKTALRWFGAIHAVMVLLFVTAALALIVISIHLGFVALSQSLDEVGAQGVIEAVGLLAAAVVALQIAQTIAEEEVVRDAHISAPTRVRRFLSRFMVVVVVALSIEGLVATFKALHENPAHLWGAASLLAATGVLLGGWGLFIKFNRAAEELEPEAMEKAKSEDHKFQ